MTNHFTDFANADVIIAVGGNPAENHPASIRHVMKAREKGGKFIVVDPRYTRSAAIADAYYPLRSGSDIALFGAVINYLLQNNLINEEYVKSYTNAAWLITPEYGFEDGMFAGWTEQDGKSAYDSTKWAYQVESETDWDTSATGAYAWTKGKNVPKFTLPKIKNVKQDLTLQNPQCVYQLMKKHYERYTPEMVEEVVGMSKAQFEELAETIGSCASDDRALTFLYAMGLAQHTIGSQNIRGLSIIQLLLGNIGIAGGGINALRGEGNVQGSTDWGLLYGNLPAYLNIPNADKHPTMADYLALETPYAGYWSNKPKFFVSMLKEFWGDAATAKNDYCYDYLPKIESKNYSHIMLFEAINEGTIKGLFCWGQNPALGGPNGNFERAALAKLDWMVCIDLMETDTARFWKLPITAGEEAPDPKTIDTEVFMLPACGHYEKEGTLSNSGRWVQWRYKALEPYADSKDDGQIMTLLVNELKDLYKNEGGAFPDPITNLTWNYVNEEGHFDSRLSAHAINGFTTADNKKIANLASLAADGSTACIGWIYSGYFNNNESDNPADQPCGARDASDATVAEGTGGLKMYPQWAWAWPMNRRVIYNRASTIKETGKARNPKRMLVEWDGKLGNWRRNDVPDFGFQTLQPDGTGIGNPPEKCPGFFMNAELVSRLFAPGLKDGPFIEHYEPVESPVKNKFSSVESNPAALVCESSKRGDASKYPYICSTIRVVEHWQTGVTTRNSPWLAEAMPFMFVEIPVELAEEKGIKNGDDVEVFNNRGTITVKAMVTKRIRPFKLGDQTVYEVAMPWHWGKVGMANGESANTLTPNYGDANSSIPESKAFLVDIKKKG